MHTRNGSNVEARVLALLPLARTILRAVIAAPVDEIERAIARLEARGDVGLRLCSLTRREVVCDRREPVRRTYSKLEVA